MNEIFNPKIRNMKAGGWYWISKAVIQEYMITISFSAFTVYNFLASMADEHQSCFPSQQFISRHLGCSRATVNRAIKVLEKEKLILVEKGNTHHCTYRLLHIDSNNNDTQMLHRRNLPVQNGDTNNTNKQELHNNTVVSVSKLLQPLKSREELLASDIAELLGDQSNDKVYLSYAYKYPESFLRMVLSEVKQTPLHKIKKSRAALFQYLLHYHAKNYTKNLIHHSGD